jgi:hypothetical protein
MGVKQEMGVHLRKPQTITTPRLWGKLVPVTAVPCGECHDNFNDTGRKLTWKIPIPPGENQMLNNSATDRVWGEENQTC